MSRYPKYPMSYADCQEILNTRSSRVISNNTTLITDGPLYHIRLHQTNVVTFHPRNIIELRTGRWNSMTTHHRINQVIRMPEKSSIGWYSANDAYRKPYDDTADIPGLRLMRYNTQSAVSSYCRFLWHEGVKIYPNGTTDARPIPYRWNSITRDLDRDLHSSGHAKTELIAALTRLKEWVLDWKVEHKDELLDIERSIV